MNLIPLVGTDEVTFGTHEKKIIKLLGRPTSRGPDTLYYEEPHWHYSLSYDLSSPDRELISVSISFSSLTYPTAAIFLWETDISEYSSYQLFDFLRLKQSEEKVIWLEGGWGEWDIAVPDC